MFTPDQLRAIKAWVDHEVVDAYPRGGGACQWVSGFISKTYGLRATEGIFTDFPDDIERAIGADAMYTHCWNYLPDGSILDGTAGQFYPDGPVVRLVTPSMPDFKRYLEWGNIDHSYHDLIDEVVQGSCPAFS